MKTFISIAAILCLLAVASGRAATHTITTPGGSYGFSIDGGPTTNTTVELVAGEVNTFNIQTVDYHPVVVCNSIDVTDWYNGADPQSDYNQLMTLTTPSSGFPETLYYMCYYHGFFGEIHLSAPLSPVPPQNTILQIRVGTNIVMTSTGTTTTWSLIPEYSSNLTSGAWSPVPTFVNNYNNGTNTTSFNRLEAICGLNAFLRLRQQKN